MDISAATEKATQLWQDVPALRFAFVDVSALAQTFLDTPGSDFGTRHEAYRGIEIERCIAGAERLALVRNPALAKPQSEYIERNGRTLIIWLYGPITHDQSAGCKGDRIAKAIATSGADTLVFRICSHGGRDLASNEVIRALSKFRGRSIAIVDAFALSAAAMIALVCDRVVMRERSVLLLHAASTVVDGNASFLKQVAMHLGNSDDIAMRSVAAHRHIHSETLRELFADGRYIPAEEALALGLCDAITRRIEDADHWIRKETNHAG